ncbi:MAG: CAAX prenyl protease-related protein [Candidatus Tectimicrobiota bacterium]
MWPRVIPFGLYMAFLFLEGLLSPLWLYPLKTLVVLAALMYYWSQYEELHTPLWLSCGEGLLALGAGLAVYAAWIHMAWPWATLGQAAGYNPFHAGESLGLALAGIRLFGAAIVVPLMEELFWRSFLLRFVITLFPESLKGVTDDFASVPLGTFTPLSCLVIVLLFGSEHNLWLAGIMAGAVYNLVLYKTQRLWPCVIAHGVTNLALGIHVLATGEWQWW